MPRCAPIFARPYRSGDLRTRWGCEIQQAEGGVLITNDGATILSEMQVFHPTAQMLVQLSKSQDIEAGDGTTGICVIAGAFLQACSELLTKGIHPTMVAEAFKIACGMSLISMISMEVAMNLTDYLIVGSAKLIWWVVPIMLFVGFLTPWPYNYWRLKKFNKACH